MNKTVLMHADGLKGSLARFSAAWKAAEKGRPTGPVHNLTVAGLDALLGVLTPRRLVLLKSLHQAGAVTVRALATRLARDYKNVHTDVAALEQVGLVVRDVDNRITAPWAEVSATLRLAG